MLDRVASLWEWLTSDVDSASAHARIDDVRDSLTAAERTTIALVRVLFAAIELVLFCGGFVMIPGMIFLLEEIAGISLGASILLGIALPGLAWFVTRKPVALVRTVLLGWIARRAGRRASLDLDAASRSGSSVAVPVDVERDEPVPRA